MTATPPRPPRHRILLAEDDPDVASALHALLSAPYDVTVTTTGGDAVACVFKTIYKT